MTGMTFFFTLVGVMTVSAQIMRVIEYLDGGNRNERKRNERQRS